MKTYCEYCKKITNIKMATTITGKFRFNIGRRWCGVCGQDIVVLYSKRKYYTEFEGVGEKFPIKVINKGATS